MSIRTLRDEGGDFVGRPLQLGVHVVAQECVGEDADCAVEQLRPGHDAADDLIEPLAGTQQTSPLEDARDDVLRHILGDEPCVVAAGVHFDVIAVDIGKLLPEVIERREVGQPFLL